MSKKKTIGRLKEEVRRRGGIVGVSEDAPPEVVKAMLEEVLHCPLCADLERGSRAARFESLRERPMRRLPLRNIPIEIQKVIRTKARVDHIRNEEAVIELIRELEIERAVQHDLAILEQQWEENEDEEFSRECGGHCHCAHDDADPVIEDPA